MPDILIHDYCKKDFEDLLELARYGANNAMIGVNMKWEELPPHGDLVDATQYRDEFMDGVYNMCADDPDNNRANVIIDLYDCAPVVVPAERRE